MNELGKQLLADLRSGKIRDEEFDMGRWLSPCGTVGCIAGHVLIRTAKTHIADYGPALVIGTATKALDLPDPIARHLFTPYRWVEDLARGYFAKRYKEIWTDNWRCDLTTIERMREWALSFSPMGPLEDRLGHTCIYNLIGRLQATNALEQALKGEPYIDWQRAIEHA